MAITDSFIGASPEAAAVDKKLSTVQFVWIPRKRCSCAPKMVHKWKLIKKILIKCTWRWSSCCCCPICCCWEEDIIDMSMPPGIIMELPLYDIDEVPCIPYTSSSGKSWLYSSVDMIVGLPWVRKAQTAQNLTAIKQKREVCYYKTRKSKCSSTDDPTAYAIDDGKLWERNWASRQTSVGVVVTVAAVLDRCLERDVATFAELPSSPNNPNTAKVSRDLFHFEQRAKRASHVLPSSGHHRKENFRISGKFNHGIFLARYILKDSRTAGIRWQSSFAVHWPTNDAHLAGRFQRFLFTFCTLTAACRWKVTLHIGAIQREGENDEFLNRWWQTIGIKVPGKRYCDWEKNLKYKISRANTNVQLAKGEWEKNNK